MKRSNTSTYSQDVEDLLLLESELGEKWKQLNLLNSITTAKPSSKASTTKSRSTRTSKITTASEGNLTLLPQVSPVQELLTLELEQASNTPNQPYLEKPLDLSGNVNQNSQLSSNPWELSIADLEQCLEDSEWSDIKASIKSSQRRSLEQATDGSDCLLFPTPTANLGTYRAAGTNRLETWLRNKELIPNGSQLSAIAYAQIQGFPFFWFEALSHSNTSTQSKTLPVQLIPQEELKPVNLQAELLPQDKQRSQSQESCTLTHCSNCNSFDSAIKNDSPWAFCLLKGKYIARDELTTCDDFTPIIPYQAPIKKRRSRGDGSGSIVKRFLSKKTKKEVKSYEQYWYDYELWENGVCLRKGSAYIPKNKLEEIELMNKDKEPVKAILERLGKII